MPSRKRTKHLQKQVSDGRMGESGMFVGASSFNKGELVLQKVLGPQESGTEWSLPTASDLAETAAEKVAQRWKTGCFMASFLNCLQYAFVGFNWKIASLEEIFFFQTALKFIPETHSSPRQKKSRREWVAKTGLRKEKSWLRRKKKRIIFSRWKRWLAAFNKTFFFSF